jgi:hypothetical protein
VRGPRRPALDLAGPAVSMRMSQLERRLGLTLLEAPAETPGRVGG